MLEISNNERSQMCCLAYCYITEKFKNKDVNDACIKTNKYLLETEEDPKLKIIYNIINDDSCDRSKAINILRKHFDIVMCVLMNHTSKDWLIDSMTSLYDDENINSDQYLRLANAYKTLYKLIDNFEKSREI